MGQNLSEPVTDKTSEDGGDERLVYGVSSMQGWRFSMEDAHTAVLNLHKFSEVGELGEDAGIESRLSLFGVYDGHGGERVAEYAGENTHKIIAKQEAFKKGHIEQALKDGFLATDRALLDDPRYETEPSGCTATVGIISTTKIYMANAGDSRAVLGVKGRAKPLSFDHKPMNEGERTRILAAGGTVEFGRVNGNLALSRAIGDFEFKRNTWLEPEQQIVTVYPDVIIHDITNDDEFLVIACDGIWDCQSSQAVIEFVRRGIAAKQELSKICENMMDNCLSTNSESGGVGCDNMTLLIVGLLHGMSKEEWYEEIARRVSNGEGPCAPPEFAELHVSNSLSKSEEPMKDQHIDPSGGLAKHLRRIILLGDGSDNLTDSDDTVLLHGDEDRDLESQVCEGPVSSQNSTEIPTKDSDSHPNTNETTENATINNE